MIFRKPDQSGLVFRSETVLAAAHALKTLGHQGLSRVFSDLGVDEIPGPNLDERANLLAAFAIKNPSRAARNGTRLDVAIVARAAHLLESTKRSRDAVLKAQPQFSQLLKAEGVLIAANHEDEEFDSNGNVNVTDPAVDVYRPYKVLPPDADGGFEEGDQFWPGDEITVDRGGDSVGNDLGVGGFGSAFGEGFQEGIEPPVNIEVSSADAQIGSDEPRITASAGMAAGAAQVRGSAMVIAPIWKNERGNILLEIDLAEQELEAVKAFVLAWRSKSTDSPNASNYPPGLVDDPNIDVEALEAAIQSLRVLRPLISQPEPDAELLKLLWNVVLTGLRAVERFATWFQHLAASSLASFLNSYFAKGVAQGAGVVIGKLAMEKAIDEIILHGPKGLQGVALLLKGALAALGHSI